MLISGANNHITDYGIDGLEDTKMYLDQIQVPYVGFGTNNEELHHTYDVLLKDKVVRFFSIAQNEFCTMESEKKGVGANPYDPLQVFDSINECKKTADFLVVLFHGGKENYTYPTPLQRKICRKMISEGADFVVCQHSHCVGCKEELDNGTIVYGTGNFIFNISDEELWNTSIVPHLAIRNDMIVIEYLPIIKTKSGVRMAAYNEKEDILTRFNKRSCEIMQEGFVEENWEKYCNENRIAILWNAFFRYPKFVYWIDRIIGRRITKLLMSNETKKLTLYNYIRCEAINEMCQTIFYTNEEKSNKLKNGTK